MAAIHHNAPATTRAMPAATSGRRQAMPLSPLPRRRSASPAPLSQFGLQLQRRR
jgi:hypothetical protein